MRPPALAAPARRERLLVAGGKPRTICWVKPGRRPDGFPPSLLRKRRAGGSARSVNLARRVARLCPGVLVAR
jgi:hypothetical protein